MRKVKISSCTTGFRNLDLEETLFILKELGFQYIEGTTDGRSHLYPYIFGKGDLRQLESLFLKLDLKLMVISGGWSDFAVVDRCLERQYASLRKQLEACRHLGVRTLRVFASHIPGQFIDQSLINRIIRNIKRIMSEFENDKVHLVIENHYGVTARADDILRLIEGVDSHCLKVNFDAANFIPMNEDPIKACQKLLPHIGHVHLKDIRTIGKTIKDGYSTGRGIHQGYELCDLGTGQIDYYKILSLLSEGGYKGIYSIEYEDPSDVVRGTLVSYNNLKNIFSKLKIYY